MAFRHPAMLWWLFALIIPVLIHLFNFRRHKTILFSNIQLLRNLQQETNKTNKLKHRLILLARLLALAALVVAFARPYVKNNQQMSLRKNTVVSIYIDNSPSMQRRGKSMTLLDEVREQAERIAGSFDLNTRFVLLSNEFHPGRNRMLSRDDFLRELSTIVPVAVSADLGDVIRRNRNINKDDEAANRFLFLLSDFQKSATEASHIVPDTSLQLVLIKTGSSTDQNLYLDTLWFESPVVRSGLEARLHFEVVNDGSQPVSGVPIRLELNGQQVAIANTAIEPGERAKLTIQFLVPQTKGFQRAVLSVQDYPIVFDDELYFSFEVMPKIRVLELTQDKPNIYTKLLFSDDDDVELMHTPITNVDIQTIPGFQLIILNEAFPLSSGLLTALDDFVASGGSLVILPSEKAKDDYNALTQYFGFTFQAVDTFSTRVSKVEEKHPFFTDVFVKIPEQADLPVVFRHFPIRMEAEANAFPLIRLLNNDPFLLASHGRGAGTVYAFAAPNNPDWSTFVNHTLFAPVLYKMLYMSPLIQPPYIANRETVELSVRNPVDASEGRLRVTDENHKTSIIPGVSRGLEGNNLIVSGLLPEATHYDLIQGDSLIGVFSVNIDRKESALKEMNLEEMHQMFKAGNYAGVSFYDSDKNWVADDTTGLIEGRGLTALFLAMTLIFLLAEVMLIRFWK